MGNISSNEVAPESFIGKLLFFPRGDTFFKVERVKRYTEEEMGGVVLLEMTDLSGQNPNPAFEPVEIGEELFLVPEGFSQGKIDTYLKLAEESKVANDTMHDIAMDIVTYRLKVDLDNEIPF